MLMLPASADADYEVLDQTIAEFTTTPMAEVDLPGSPRAEASGKEWLRYFIRNEDAATNLEYGVILALLMAVFLTAASSIGSRTYTVFSKTARSVGAASAPTPAERMAAARLR